MQHLIAVALQRAFTTNLNPLKLFSAKQMSAQVILRDDEGRMLARVEEAHIENTPDLEHLIGDKAAGIARFFAGGAQTAVKHVVEGKGDSGFQS